MSDEEKDISRFESVPRGLKLSGPGLENMPLERFHALAQTLSDMGVEVEAVDEASAEEDGEDTPIYQEDFQAYAKEHGLSKNLATLAWNALWRGRRYLKTDIAMEDRNDEKKGKAMSRQAVRHGLAEDTFTHLTCVGSGVKGLLRGVVGTTEPPQR